MLHITEEQAAAALPMARALELVEESFRRLDDGRALNHPRRRIRLENGALLHAMDAGDNVSGLLGAKLYATRPRVGAHFLVALFDAETTKPLAVIEADALGRIRTGAASGVATKLMAREDASVLGMVGSGWQAETQLEACAAVRKLEQVKVFSRKAEKREAFAAKMGQKLGLDVRAVESAEAAVRGADIVVTITSAKAPVAFGEWLAPGCHVNAAGSNHALRAEIDADAVERAGLIAADSVEQAKIEAGDLIQAAEQGRLDWSRVVELSGIALRPAAGACGRATDHAVRVAGAGDRGLARGGGDLQEGEGMKGDATFAGRQPSESKVKETLDHSRDTKSVREDLQCGARLCRAGEAAPRRTGPKAPMHGTSVRHKGASTRSPERSRLSRRTLLAGAPFVFVRRLTGQTAQEKGRQYVHDALDALGGQNFLDIQNQVASGRAYSFYNASVRGLARITVYERFDEMQPNMPEDWLPVSRREVYTEKGDFFSLFVNGKGWEVTFQGARPLPLDMINRYRLSVRRDFPVLPALPAERKRIVLLQPWDGDRRQHADEQGGDLGRGGRDADGVSASVRRAAAHGALYAAGPEDADSLRGEVDLVEVQTRRDAGADPLEHPAGAGRRSGV